MTNRLIFICAVIWVAGGCQRKYPEDKPVENRSKELLLRASKAVVHAEAKAIEEFISSHGWRMQKTGTGLRYQVYQEGKGRQADGTSVLTISYKVFLLDGTLCYEADKQHPLKLVTGKGDQVRGLEEGLLMMNEGARARFVIPNHLAYGLTGDQDKIPPASPLYYDVHLIKIESPQLQK